MTQSGEIFPAAQRFEKLYRGDPSLDGGPKPIGCTAILTALSFGTLHEYECPASLIFRMRIPRIFGRLRRPA
jgi:hypothetical protein